MNPNEIRSLAARLIPVPFVGDSLFNFYEKIYNCSSPDDVEKEGISLENLFSCEEIKPLFQTSMKNQLQYKFFFFFLFYFILILFLFYNK
mgnify:CR=1 FL=1